MADGDVLVFKQLGETFQVRLLIASKDNPLVIRGNIGAVYTAHVRKRFLFVAENHKLPAQYFYREEVKSVKLSWNGEVLVMLGSKLMIANVSNSIETSDNTVFCSKTFTSSSDVALPITGTGWAHQFPPSVGSHDDR